MPEKQPKGLTRRSFLKTTAAAAGTVALSDALLSGCSSLGASDTVSANDQGQIVYSNCKAPCMGGCRLKLLVKDGKIVRITAGDTPEPDVYKGICLKGVSNMQRTYDVDRIKYPMKRIGERGSDEWEQISWDEAIETITGKWKEYQKEFGEHSIFFMAGCGGAAGGSIARRLSNLMNGSGLSMGTDMANIMWTAYVMGVGPYHGGNEYADLLNAKCILLWGVNPTDAQIQQYHFITEAQKNGAKIISINPNCSRSTYRSDLHIPIRVGTDTPLAFAMINVVLEKGWVDEPFLKASTVAPMLVKATDKKFLRLSDLGIAPTEGPINPQTGKPAVIDPLVVWDETKDMHVKVEETENPAIHGTFTINGIEVTTAFDLLIKQTSEWTPSKAAALCDIPEEMIYQAAEIYVKNSPSTIYTMYGFDHYTNGHYGYWAAMTLAAITGNAGKPGASAGLAVGNMDSIFATSVPADPATDKGPTIAAPVMLEAFEKGEYLGKPITPKAAYLTSNSLRSIDRQKWVEAYAKFEFIVIQDFRFTETVRLLADIALPASYWFEWDDLYSFFTPFAFYNPRAIEPLYESKPDFEIYKMLGGAMGFADKFTETSEELIEKCLDGAYAKSQGITYSRIKEELAIRCFPKTKEGGPFVYGEDGKFSTATGRIQFYLESPNPTMSFEQDIDFDNEHLPHFEPPTEAWDDNPLREKYPISCYQAHEKWRVHSGFAWAPWLKELDPEPVVKLSKVDAEKRGIKPGDTVRVFNDRGHVVVKARIDNGLRPGVMNIPHGWEYPQFISGHTQDLTSLAHNPICVNGAFSDLLAEVEKV